MSGELLNPFPGLRSFEPDEAHLFFGREAQVDELLARLGRTRFLSVIGVSGSGKSSLVRSGLIPSLHGGYMAKAGNSWRIAICRPGDGPISNLAAALADPVLLGDPDHPRELVTGTIEATLRRGERGLLEAYQQARLPQPDNLLVVIDQFEELFRFKRSSRATSQSAADDEAAAFVRFLLVASQSDEVPVYIVLTMRSDFLGNCAELHGLPEAINSGQYLIPRMSREQRRTAITGPVAVGGSQITQRLVMRLLNDVGDSPDQLPILQHALMRTWDYWQKEHRDAEPIDLHHYLAAGTLAEALSLHAEEAFGELDSDHLRRCAEKLFKCLTQLDEEGKGIRRPETVSKICAVTGFRQDEVSLVIEAFRKPGRTFLMPPAGVPLTGATVIDISHESLMRVWWRLRLWVDEEADSARQYRRLAEAAEMYQQGRAGLLRDPELELLLQWRRKVQPNRAWAVQYDPDYEQVVVFLELSEEERIREIVTREREAKKKLSRLRLLSLSLLIGVIVMVGLFVWTSFTLRNAREQLRRKAAESEQEIRRLQLVGMAGALAMRSRSLVRENSELAALAARQAYLLNQAHNGPPRRPEIYDALLESLRALSPPIDEVLSGHSDTIRALALTPDGATLISAGDDRQLRSLDLGDPAARLVLLEQLDTGVRSLAFHWDSQRLAVGGADGSVHLIRPGEPYIPCPTPQIELASVSCLAFARDGHFLAIGDSAGTLILWLLGEAGRVQILIQDPEIRFTALALSSDGGRLASGSSDGLIRLWQTQEPYNQLRALGPIGDICSLAFNPEGRFLAAGASTGAIRVWDLHRPGAEPHQLSAHESSVNDLDFSPDGKLLASASSDHTVRLWAHQGEGDPIVLRGHQSWVSAVAFNASGTQVFSGGADQSLRRWSTGPEELAVKVCSRVTRNLTQDEWNRLLPADLPYEETCPGARR
jgi:cell division protein FtsL/energy-coupling factor transporter ATP-binding protein EcfA2